MLFFLFSSLAFLKSHQKSSRGSLLTHSFLEDKGQGLVLICNLNCGYVKRVMDFTCVHVQARMWCVCV